MIKLSIEEIITYLLLVIVGYYIIKMFNRSCNGFRVGGRAGDCSENLIFNFIDTISTIEDCKIDPDTQKLTQCLPNCKTIYTAFYERCESDIKNMGLNDEFKNINDVCYPQDCITTVMESKYNTSPNNLKTGCENDCIDELKEDSYCTNNEAILTGLCNRVCNPFLNI